ncbi:hypothetical protein EN802_04940 [bacterium M00.F.Ca.ET.159.01.1.1]|nr:hypothetical protein EN873_25340 [bacterium M00.F.Ca.ET.230.01.1.1]TGT75590.1 hypothetical protein EN802_04940 [bacterium M00.F.Ca.ET.159.01.1.1]TGT81540.1 hypothetical protein EN800_22010 [bacterium M00.F.Ca.ET.157.01.1.1]
MTDTSQWPAVPVYKPRDYLRILELSATGDLPATWEDWWEAFQASDAEQRRRGSPAIRVQIHAGKFKAWLQANSRSSSEQTRQQFAQQRLDMKRARRAERRIPKLPSPPSWGQAPALPSHRIHRPLEILAYLLLAIAIGSVLVAIWDGWRGWSLRELPDWPLP